MLLIGWAWGGVCVQRRGQTVPQVFPALLSEDGVVPLYFAAAAIRRWSTWTGFGLGRSRTGAATKLWLAGAEDGPPPEADRDEDIASTGARGRSCGSASESSGLTSGDRIRLGR